MSPPLDPTTINSVLYIATGFLILVNIPLLFWVYFSVKRNDFEKMKFILVITSGVIWGVISVLLFCSSWEIYYQYFYPAWMKPLAPLNALMYGFVTLVMWLIAVKLPWNPALVFCLLGGLESLIEHLWGIYHLGILEKTPIFQGTNPALTLLFAFPEYILYWGSIVLLSKMIYKLFLRSHGEKIKQN